MSIASLKSVVHERIPDAGTGKGKYGYLTQIRLICDQLFVCGDLRQVYQRRQGSWVHIDDQILVRNPLAVGQCLNSIDGISPDDVYVVGDRGYICHYDGGVWTETGSPTNYNLERVLCVSQEEVYICGKNGLFLRGNRKGWEIIDVPDGFDEDFWGLAAFRGRVFLSTAFRVMVWDGHRLDDVDLGVEPTASLNRLRASDQALWVIGLNDLIRFDGEEWKLIIYPDNL